MGFAQRPSLYVFLPSTDRPYAVQESLTGACPDFEVTVFGRYRAFEKQLADAPPDAVLTPFPVWTQQIGFRVILRGSRGGSLDEEFVLLSVDKPVAKSEVPTMTLGVVDLLGRRNMRQFLSDKLTDSGVEVAANDMSLRMVTKPEDLLSLLQFGDVGAIFIPRSMVAYYNNRSRLTLPEARLLAPGANRGPRVGLAVLAVSANDPDMIRVLRERFAAMNEDTKNQLGVDTWVLP